MKGPRAYYNENDSFAADWLEELIREGQIADGEIDRRSIADVRPSDLRGFRQHHFFAGIGGWSLALRLAGWPDDRPIWTGSCPCQPFSASGQRKGFDDERHVWPAWHWLIEQFRPDVIVGEQVASLAALAWWDLVSTDLEGIDYACAPIDLPAASVRAPHIRQRIWWLAYANGTRSQGRHELAQCTDERAAGPNGLSGELALPGGQQSARRGDHGSREGLSADRARASDQPRRSGALRELADDDEGRRPELGAPRLHADGPSGNDATRCGAPDIDPWAGLIWIACRDGKLRPIEPESFPLADGVPARVGRLRGYGNAIVPALAAEFIRACEDVLKEMAA